MSNIFKWNESTQSKKVIQLKSIGHSEEKQSLADDGELDFEVMKQQALGQIEAAQKEANEILNEAKTEAEQIHNHAKEESYKLKEEAKEQGFHQGYQDGKSEAEKEYSALIEQANEIVNSAKQESQFKIMDAEQTILQIAVTSTERILQHRLENEPETFTNLIKNTIKEVIEQSDVTLKIHPDNYELVLEHKDNIKLMFPRQVDLTIFPDSSLAQHSCMVETPIGIIDASIDTQLKQLESVLLNLYKGVE